MNFDDFVKGYAQMLRNDADVFTYNEAMKLYSNHCSDRSVGMLAGMKAVEEELPCYDFGLSSKSSTAAVNYVGINGLGRMQYIE